MLFLFGFFILIVAFLLIFYLFKTSEKKLSNTFKALSYDLLEKNQASFLQLASQHLAQQGAMGKQDLEEKEKAIASMLEPIKDSLKKVTDYAQVLEKQRESAYSGLSQQISSLSQTERLLKTETANLAKALKSPNIRGAWGQLHLKRVVELSGMLANCDFSEQTTVVSDGQILRPDLIVRLPHSRQLVVDAKTPIDSYLEAQETENLERKKHKLKKFLKSLKDHMRSLSLKEYYKQFQPSPEYVILFLPLEALFATALELEPALLEEGVKNNILLATPTTLIAILRAVAYSWRQESLSQNVLEIAKIGQELTERLFLMQQHFQKVGKNLSQAVESYNSAAGSFNSRVMASAKKFQKLGLGKEEEPKSLEEVLKRPNF